MADERRDEVAVLLEEALTAADAATIAGLHDTAATHYYLVVPVEDAVGRVASTLAALGEDTVAAASSLGRHGETMDEVQREVVEYSRTLLARSLETMRATGASADGEITDHEPVDRLKALAVERSLFEVVIVARPHPIAETFHLDWAHRARRQLGLPVLHLVASKYAGSVTSEYPEQL